MKVAILAGGVGSRLAEETAVRPKPLVEIGGMPILWHILRHYSHYSFREFVIALGYRGDQIKRFIADYCSLSGSITVDGRTGKVSRLPDDHPGRGWTVDLVETGENTGAGGRLKRLAPHLGNETFMLTYGDGVSDVDLSALLAFHKAHGRLATLTAVRPPGRYGTLQLDADKVARFAEKSEPQTDWINGGFFVLEPGIFDYIPGDSSDWGGQPLENLARDGELMAFKHDAFWQCMDTLQEKAYLEGLWQEGKAPWKLWR